MNFVKIVLSVLNLLKDYFPLHITKSVSEVTTMWRSKNLLLLLLLLRVFRLL